MLNTGKDLAAVLQALEVSEATFHRWRASLDDRTLYVEPGSPWQNGYEESFHSRLRDELLNLKQFDSARHARAHASAWQEDYNEYRPHGSLDGLTPERVRASVC